MRNFILMDKSKLLGPEMTFLNTYSESLISKALEIANENPEINEFYRLLEDAMNEDFGIDHRLFLYLHHPFHWEFFCSNNGSPFEYIQPTRPGECTLVKLKHKELSSENRVEKLVESFWARHGTHFVEKFKTYRLEDYVPQSSLASAL